MDTELAETTNPEDEERNSVDFRSEFKRGIASAAPLLAALLAYGMVLGAQATQKGLSFVEVPLMTASNYAGGSEFAAIGLWDSPPPILLIAAVTLLINSRHLIMGAALTPFIRRLTRRKALVALYFMSDECWALTFSETQRRVSEGSFPAFSPGYYAGCGASIYLAWVGATTLGAAIGPVLGDIDSYGFDMAFPAVFLVLLAGMWKGPRAARPWLVSLVVAALTYLLVPGAWYVMAGALSGIAAAAYWAKPA
jgi:branched chain amino acid efflux pump